jgi:UPF0755 protein
VRARRLIAVGLIAAVALAAGGAALFGWYAGRVQRPFKGFNEPERFVTISPGMGVSAIGRRLLEAGVVSDRVTYRLAVRLRGAERSLKAGEYRFAEARSALDVVDRIARGDVYLVPITFPEGLTVAAMAGVFAERGLGSAESFRAAARDAALVRAFDPAAADLEGYLFPDTYRLPRQATAEDLVERMVARFVEVFGPQQRERAKAAGWSVRQVVTLASLVEKETARDEERPIVAAVYINRLRRKMGMQADPTVIYALERAGRYTGNLTRADLRFDSPYNTYRYAGLPPGPIAAPGRASLEAVLAPAEVPYLYFVSRNDGSHVFATTLAEHNRNVRAFQVEYFRSQRARERAAGPVSGTKAGR